MNVLYKDESYKIIGACFEVYNELGNGFDEPIYHESLERECQIQSIPYESEPQINVQYKGQQLEKYFRPDMIVYERIILELKAVKVLNDIHRQQLLNYLKATGCKLGILINFGSKDKLEYERIVR